MIDAHAHILPNPSGIDALIDAGVIESAWLLALPELAAPYDPSHPELVFGTNRDVLAAAKRHPDFFRPFGYLDLRLGPDQVDDMRAAGFVGLKAIFADKPYDDPANMAHYERAEALGMPIMFHLGGLGPVRERDLGDGLSARAINMRPCHLGTIAGNFPKLTCIGAHLGQSWHGEVMECMRCYPNLFFDISGGDTVFVMRWLLDHLGEPSVVDHLLAGLDIVYGADEYHQNILEKARFWGSFFSYTGAWFCSDDHARRILHGNAASIEARMRRMA
jgi:predicted TIM-barrel fold metal-dependent hydrolase